MYNENEKYTHPDIFGLDPDLDWIELLGKYRIWMMQKCEEVTSECVGIFCRHK
jgi:hypothetical protein